MTLPRAVVFDFDLTLVDSRAGIAACHAYAMRELALPNADALVAEATTMIGLPVHQVFARLFPESELVDEYARLYFVRAEEIMTASTSLLPGARETVEELRRRSVRLSIVSTKLRARVEEFLRREGLLSSFDAVIGPEDVPTYKPEPEGLLLALERLGVEKSDALYVGDTLIDAETARRAGVAFIAVLSGFVPKEQFEGFEAVAFLEGVKDLPALLFD
ncbi:MAG: HAD family hydrolase [Dehalococcoidia bacterium]